METSFGTVNPLRSSWNSSGTAMPSSWQAIAVGMWSRLSSCVTTLLMLFLLSSVTSTRGVTPFSLQRAMNDSKRPCTLKWSVTSRLVRM